MRRGRLFSIRGTALDSSGAPVTGTVWLVRETVSTHIDVDATTGRFATRPLPPGDYGIRVEIAGPGNPQDTREREVGFASVRVGGSDVAGLVVRAAKAVAISGRVEFEGGVPASRPIVNVNTRPLSGGVITVAAAMDGTFSLAPVRAGEYLIAATREGDVPGWIALTSPGQLKRLAKVATRIVLSDDEVRSIDLKRVKPR